MSDLIVLQHGPTRVTVAPVYGGRVAQIELFDRRGWLSLLLDDATTAIADRHPLAWGCYPMAPWPNRIAGGRFAFDGRSVTLPVNDGDHALHGLAFDRPWEVVQQQGSGLVMRFALDAGPWPWRASCTHEISIVEDGVRMTLEVRSLDAAPFPAGVGWHPWFRRSLGPRGGVRLLVDADEFYELDAMIPTGHLLPVDDFHDLRGYPALGDRRIDACYAAPRGGLGIRWNDVELTMRSSANVRHAVVYTTPHAVCVEPQTCTIDAFNLATHGSSNSGMQVVPPGGVLRATTEWHWTIDEA